MAGLQLIHVYYILTLTSGISAAGRVLVAGNEDAFRTLAKKFAPQALVNRLASLVQSAPAPAYEDTYDTNPNEGGQNEPIYANRDYGNAYANAADNPVVNPYINPIMNPVMNPIMNPADPANPPEYPAMAPFETPDENTEDSVQQTTKVFRQNADNAAAKKTQAMQVNLDELVEKVKEKLLQELKTRQTPVSKPRLKARPKPPRQLSVARPVPQPISQNQAPPIEYEDASPVVPVIPSSPPALKKKRPPPRIVNGPAQTKKGKPAGILVEKSDLYDKFKLSKHKGKDSYEDYVIPKKEYNIFEPHEEDKIVKREFSKELTGTEQEQKRVTVKRKEVKEQIDDTVFINNDKDNNNNKNAPGKRLKAATPNIATTKNQFTEPTSKIEYVDDDYYTKVTTTEHIPKAMTEFIGADSKEDQEPAVTETTTELEKGRKKKPKKIVTNMPTRARFKMCTPNYYEKLPRIAEKYNFDEPIPERDREDEDLKSFPTVESNINGKVKV